QRLAAALNQGLKLARSPYIARMDGDDIALPERLEIQAAFLDAHPDLGVVGTQARIIDLQDRDQGPFLDYPRPSSLVAWHILTGSPLIHPSTFMRTDVLRSVGGYDPAYPVAQDQALWTRLLFVTRLANLPDTLLLYRRHPDAASQVHNHHQRDILYTVRTRAASRLLGRDVDPQALRRIRVSSARGVERFTRADAEASIDLLLHLFEAMDPFFLSDEKSIVRREMISQIARLSWRVPPGLLNPEQARRTYWQQIAPAWLRQIRHWKDRRHATR
ncbi:MAG: glycosyltransferase, partial [Anaerolineae bacterium]